MDLISRKLAVALRRRTYALVDTTRHGTDPRSAKRLRLARRRQQTRSAIELLKAKR